MIPFGAWLPDQPDYRDQPSLTEALNVFPRADGSWDPITAPAAITAALPDRCLGLFSYRTLAGDYGNFAATSSHLYRLQTSGTWQQVSKSGGYSLQISEFERPAWAQFGSQVIAVMGHGDETQVFNIDGGSQFGDLATDAPRAKDVAVVRDFVMVANTWSPSQGARPDQVWWSGIGNPASWPAPGSSAATSVQSDRQVLPGIGHLQRVVPDIGGRDAAIFGERGIVTCHYEGSPTIFRFDPVQGAKGCYAAGSVVRVDNTAYYIAADGFHVFDGARSIQIGRGVIDKWFLNDLDDTFRDYIYGAYDVERGLVLWLYPGAGHASVPNRLICHEPSSGRFSRSSLAADLIASSSTNGYTLEGLDALGYTIDTLPFSLDSRVWKGGSPFVGIVDSTQHKLSAFGTSTLQADLTTNEFSGQNGSRIWIDGLRIYGDVEPSSAAIAHRDRRSSSLTTTSYVQQEDDFIDHLVATRYARVKVRVPSGTAWTSLQGYDIRFRQEGLG